MRRSSATRRLLPIPASPVRRGSRRNRSRRARRRCALRELRLPADEQRVVVRRRTAETPAHLVRHTGSALPLRSRLQAVAEAEEPLHQPGRLGTDEHRSRSCLRLQPRGDVDGVADGAVFDAAACTDRPDDDGAGVDADPHAEALIRSSAPPRTRTCAARRRSAELHGGRARDRPRGRSARRTAPARRRRPDP